MGSRRILAWCVAAAAGAVVLEEFVPTLASSPSAAPPESAAPSAALPPLEGLASLPERGPIAPPQGELFGPRSWQPPPPAQQKRSDGAKRTVPRMPYRVAGQLSDEGGVRVVLAKEDRVFTVREGQVLEDGYRVESIRPDAVILVYLPLARRERLEVSGTRLELEGSARAQLRDLPQAASGGTAAR